MQDIIEKTSVYAMTIEEKLNERAEMTNRYARGEPVTFPNDLQWESNLTKNLMKEIKSFLDFFESWKIPKKYCKQCGKRIFASPSRLRSQDYCDRSCHLKGRFPLSTTV